MEIRLLGGFDVAVDEHPIPADAWPQRRAADLVKLLALADGHRLARDQVLEALWPQLETEPAAANLHKAASYARRALGDRSAVVLRAGQVQLAPGAAVMTDVERLEAGHDDVSADELLPDDRYEAWTLAPRERVRALRLAGLRRRGLWEDVLRAEPSDEEAARALARAALEAGDRATAVRTLRALRDALSQLGMRPSEETLALEAQLASGPAVRAPLLFYAPIVGRDRELDFGRSGLRQAAGGQGGALFVTGAAGMGKSRFIDALVEDGERSGFHTLRGGAHAEEGTSPYAPFVEAIDPLVEERPDLTAGLSAGALSALALIVPSAARGAAEEGAAVDRHRILSAVGQLLVAAARDRPVLLVLDDLHAADDATLGLVHYLARTARRASLMLILGAREEAIGAPLARVRSSLIEQHAGVEVALGRLDRTAVRAIAERVAGRPLPEATVRALDRSSAGNPFFVEELAAGVDAVGEVTVPRRLHQVLEARLERLSDATGDLMAPLAVIEDGFNAGEVAALARRDEDEVAAALESARATGVLDRARSTYRFRHPLVREALVARVPERQLERAHRAAAAMLGAEGAPPERIAHHLLHSGQAEAAVPLLLRAAEWAAGVAAYADGAAWVEQALAHAADDLRPRLLALRADLLGGTGDPRAEAAFADAIAASSGSDADDLRLKRARACIISGDIAEARRMLEEVEPASTGDQGRTALLRSMLTWFEGDIDASRRHAEEAEPLLEQAGRHEDLAMLDDARAMLAHAEGDWASHARWRLRESTVVPELAGRVFDAYLCVTEYVLYSGEPYAQLSAFAKQLRAQAQRGGARRGEAFAATLLGETELLTGNLGAAREHLFEAVRLNREVGASGGEALARMRLGEALLHAGDRDGATAQLEEALELSQSSSLARHLIYLVHGVLVQVPIDPEEGLQLVDQSEALLPAHPICAYCPTGYHVAAATTCATAGRLERARDHLALAERGAELWPPGPWRAALAEARGRLLVAEGAEAEGAAALRRAAEGYAAAGQRLYERRARSALTA
jgi:DNA-binding SARP family transcriptional activator/tetratricopeptide (TPR) repeat protein